MTDFPDSHIADNVTRALGLLTLRITDDNNPTAVSEYVESYGAELDSNERAAVRLMLGMSEISMVLLAVLARTTGQPAQTLLQEVAATWARRADG